MMSEQPFSDGLVAYFNPFGSYFLVIKHKSKMRGNPFGSYFLVIKRKSKIRGKIWLHIIF